MSIGLNDGGVHTRYEIEQNGIEKSAEEFSEGSKILKSTLLSLWNVDIDTKACCKGTFEKNHKTDSMLRIPYISIPFDRKNKEKVIKLIQYLIEQKNNSKPNISLKMYANYKLGKAIVLDKLFFTNAGTKKMFESILFATSKLEFEQEVNQTKLTKNLNTIFDILANSTLLTAQNLDLSIKKQKATLFVTTFDNKKIKIAVADKNMKKIIDTLEENLNITKESQSQNTSQSTNITQSKSQKIIRSKQTKFESENEMTL